MDKKYDDTEHRSFTEKVFLIPFKILIYPIAFLLVSIYEGMKWIGNRIGDLFFMFADGVVIVFKFLGRVIEGAFRLFVDIIKFLA